MLHPFAHDLSHLITAFAATTCKLTFWTWPGWGTLTAVAALIAAVATTFYTWFTYHLLASSKVSIDIANKLTEFQIYSKLTDQLSSDKALRLLDIIESNWFEIDEISEPPQPGEFQSPAKEVISGKELRRFVLSPIEDLAKFREDGLLSMRSIDAGFGNTILMLGNSELVVDFVKHLRSKVYFSDNIHSGFESLYEAELECCNDEERSKYANHF